MCPEYKFLFIFLISCSSQLFSQDSPVHAKVRIEENYIMLRWAPDNPEIWRAGIKNGYVVRRTELNVEKKLSAADFEKANIIAQVKPFSKSDSAWIDLLKQDQNSILAFMAMYENNQNNPVTSREKEKMENMLFGLSLLSADMSREIAKAMGLYLKDSLTDNKKIYAYSIEIPGADPEKIRPCYVIAGASGISSDPALPAVMLKSSGRLVQISWEAAAFRENFAGYVIERSPDSLVFAKVSKSPVIFMQTEYEKNKSRIHYTDTVPEENRKYFYRIRGINHFGGSTSISPAAGIQTFSALKGFPVIDTAMYIEKNRVLLKWKLSDSADLKTVRGFRVLQGKKIHGDYKYMTKVLLKPSARQFTDTNIHSSVYYKVVAAGISGDSSVSYPAYITVYDRDPPEAPLIVGGNISQKGKVSFSWRANKEPDLKGYRVFRANSVEEEFTEVTKIIIKDTLFSDSLNLNTLTKEIFYRVTAVDVSYNNSDFSPVFKISRPDTVPPVQVFIKSASSGEKGIRLEWTISNSKDAAEYILYHWQQGKTETVSGKWNAGEITTGMIDSLADPGEEYFYKIVCADSSGNFSISNVVQVSFENGKRKKITNIRQRIDREQKTISLAWNYPENDIYSYLIYKKKKNEMLRVYKTLPPGTTSFTDDQLSISNTYIYHIKAVFTNGAEGELSDPVVVDY